MIRYIITPTSLGRTLLAQSEKGLCCVAIGDSDAALGAELQACFPKAEITAGDETFKKSLTPAIAWIDNPQGSFPLQLDIQGTELQKAVWQQLLQIPYGETITYSQLAERVGKPTAIRAVANACGANNLAVIIPCHRVLRKSGDLGGYAWGIERKIALLAREKIPVSVAA